MRDAEVPTIELATVDDLSQIVDIFNQSAAHSIANFNTRPASTVERSAWFESHTSTGPHRLLVARRSTSVLGYAASGLYRDHEAFCETVDVSVLLRSDCRRRGLGTQLYRALFEHLTTQPVHVALAGIALPNDASVALHRKFGFTTVGTFREYALKHDQYISSLWMQRLFRPD